MSKERELLERVIAYENNGILDFCGMHTLKNDITELLTQPEGITPRQGLFVYKGGFDAGYKAAVMDLKQKVDSVFTAIMEEDDE